MRILPRSPVLAALLFPGVMGHAQQVIGRLPATFTGTLPCADCPGIRYQLNLMADHTFASRMVYEDRNRSFDDHGTWKLVNDGKMLVLVNGRESQDKYAVRDAETLRKLDAEGHEIQSKFDYDLKRAPQFKALGAHSGSNISLENITWKLSRLGANAVTAASPQQEAQIRLGSADHRVSGSGGCNRITGEYELTGDQLTFSKMASTRMACVQGMDTEQAFLTALDQVRSWKVTGQKLKLFDGDGHVAAELEAQKTK